MKFCKDISCITHNHQTKPTKGTLILFSRCIFRVSFAYLRGDEWSLRTFASMPSAAIFLRARASEHSFKFCEKIDRAKVTFCEQLKILMDHSSPLTLPWHRIVKVQLRVINKMYVVNKLVDGVKRYYVLIN